MRRTILFTLVLFSIGTMLIAQETDPRADKIIRHYAAQNFIAGNVSKTELDTVLASGVHAPSASNRQPWHFTVVQDQRLTKQIISNIVDGNVLIIVTSNRIDNSAFLDCGLAVQSMYLAAQSIGLGSRIYTGPIGNINNSLKTALGFPNGHNAIALVRIGRVQPIDAVSAASSRKNANTIINYK
jgi:nitroreductase